MNEQSPDDWAGPDGEVGRTVAGQTERCLRAYKENPLLIEEHANIERATAHGGYGRRQIFELVQNGADELIKEPGGRIHVLLTEDTLYCANEGTPIQPRGVEAILSAALSVKRGDEIGRFGMGFKSVLGVTDTPDFFSRSGSFRFDSEWAGDRIRAISRDATRTPVLRVAYPLDPEKASAFDSTLRELMQWASTVVRLPVDRKRSHWLATDLDSFPAEFLLFSSHVGSLILEDRVSNLRRTIELEQYNGVLRVTEGNESSSWKVFKRVHKPSRAAREEAGELADRQSLPIVWAVPTEGRRRTSRGTLWAFFPTHYQSTLSGILNAPWKTNEDRQNLLEGPFNEELLREASKLVVESLDALAVQGDPAAHLDVMPARGREAPNWADALITETVFELAAARASLPDQDGTLRLPSDLKCHPSLPVDVLKEWSSYPKRPKDWCHHTVETRERRPRAERLLNAAEGSTATLLEWLEALGDGTPDASIVALRTANRLLMADANTKSRLKQAEIVFTLDSRLAAPDPDTLSLPGDYVPVGSHLSLVHPDVVADPVAKAFLLEMGLREADPLQEIRGRVASGLDDLDDEGWGEFWRLIRSAGHEAVAATLFQSKTFRLHAKAMDRSFYPIEDLLLPGPIVAADGSADRQVGVDTTYHSDDIDFLRMLGVNETPRPGGGSRNERWFRLYELECKERFVRSIGRNPNRSYLKFSSNSTFSGPLTSLPRLSAEGRARLTEAALASDPEAEPWIMYHSTRRQAYPELAMPNPMAWQLRREGRLHTSLGIQHPSQAVGPQLSDWQDILPVASIPDSHANILSLPSSLDEMTGAHWESALKTAQGIYDDHVRGRFYATAAKYRRVPAELLCRVGRSHRLEAPNQITAVSTEREMRALADQGIPVLLCPSDGVLDLVQKWGLSHGSLRVSTRVDHTSSVAPVPITDQWPLLAPHFGDADSSLVLQACDSLQLITETDGARHAEAMPFYRADGQILYSEELSEHDLLRLISDEFGLRLDEADIAHVIEQRISDERRRELTKIATLEDPADRVLAAVGGRALRQRLSPALVEAAERTLGPVDDIQAAKLFVASHGVNTLKELSDELKDWTPPTQWAGSRRAREFATSLGFGIEFAGFPSDQRDPLLTVDGPLTLPPLHDFQREIGAELRRVLRDEDGNRALLSLPTGAGKTRVAVQTVVEAFKDGDLAGPVLWVAQSDELCEQAVQAWSEVWRAEGTESRMYVSRLWGTNEVAPMDGGLQVVVAGIDKLRRRIDREDYEWLWRADCIIIDEAHGSVTPEYTRLLNAFGMGRGVQRVPLVGLTATPFRGENEPETQLLASRYGNRLLDVGVLGPDPYRTLQDRGVLAKVEHQILPGSEVDLSEEERNYLETYGRMPGSVENRLGADTDRNAVILESIRSLPEDWTALLFASSVEQAHIMAALLTMADVPAAAISGGTETGARRHYIEEFREGRIRVLTNYGVLTQGFDAPAVRAVYVARPTFSPNLYQQMIGRGLRGPANGGEETCRIVNVADNFLRWGEELAFHRFEYLWNPDREP